MNVLEGLNPEQEQAVKHFKGPLLILAGAGSGKTRVLTHRIAYLIEEYGVNPWNILAITFTNKAAGEMRERVDNIVTSGAEYIWVSTFHSACVRILRRHIEALGYSRSFTIYDADDQRTLMRDILKYLQLDPKKFKERSVLGAISSAKDEMITPEEYERRAAGDYLKEIYARAYREYEKRLRDSNALDFDDLIVKTIQLLQDNPEILDYYQNRFRYIMVDEYQDTNTAQFELVRLLADSTGEDGRREQNLCVVGDDDQSIYKFRGANIYNILNFETEYPDAKVIKLEKNYKHTIEIVVDRLSVKPEIRSRLADSIETCCAMTGGLVVVDVVGGEEMLFSQNYACPDHDISIEELSPNMFSFNNPAGSCPTCTGLGVFQKVDPALVVRYPDRSIRDGAFKVSGWSCDPGTIGEMYFTGLEKHFGVPLDIPVKDMPKDKLDLVLFGTKGEKFEMVRHSAGFTGKFTNDFEGIVNNLERRFKETTSDWMKYDIATFMSAALPATATGCVPKFWR